MGTAFIHRVLEDTSGNLLSSINFLTEATEKLPEPSKDQTHLSLIETRETPSIVVNKSANWDCSSPLLGARRKEYATLECASLAATSILLCDSKAYNHGNLYLTPHFLVTYPPRKKVVDAALFKGIVLDSSMQLSHMFYANDAVFVGQWSDSNIDTIVHVLECFHRASGLRFNMSKSKLMGIAMDVDRVEQAASKIRCAILKAPFSYLGSKVGGLVSRIQSWNEIVDIMVARLSKWKMKTLSIGGR
nr:RNA-directed DNA polymerase, eukaryota, reverse transcriptase zinc-binding domain protein [Tanacetum cinerariifolium]